MNARAVGAEVVVVVEPARPRQVHRVADVVDDLLGAGRIAGVVERELLAEVELVRQLRVHPEAVRLRQVLLAARARPCRCRRAARTAPRSCSARSTGTRTRRPRRSGSSSVGRDAGDERCRPRCAAGQQVVVRGRTRSPSCSPARVSIAASVRVAERRPRSATARGPRCRTRAASTRTRAGCSSRSCRPRAGSRTCCSSASPGRTSLTVVACASMSASAVLRVEVRARRTRSSRR